MDRDDEIEALWAAIRVVVLALLLAGDGRLLAALDEAFERSARSVALRRARRRFRRSLPSILRASR